MRLVSDRNHSSGLTGLSDLASLAIMHQVPVTDLKNRLSEFLRLVKHGETIEVMERNVAIARIEAIVPASDSSGSRFQQLVREGVISQPKHRLEPEFFSFRPIACKESVVQALLEERDER